MGLKDFFTKDGRAARALAKNCAKAANKKIKPDDRRPALYELLQEGSDQAVEGLLRRFTFNYDTNMVMDEEEKSYVYEGLLSIGERIVPIVVKHLKTSPTLSWGLRLVTDLCDHEGAWAVLEEMLQDYDQEYERDPSRKVQLMTFLGEFADERAVHALIPFLKDDDETVCYVVVEALFKQDDEAAREPLLKLLVDDDDDSLRIKNRIIDGFQQTGWTVKGFRGTVKAMLAGDFPDFTLNAKGRVKLKKARTE